jgi:hypothetical protein
MGLEPRGLSSSQSNVWLVIPLLFIVPKFLQYIRTLCLLFGSRRQAFRLALLEELPSEEAMGKKEERPQW